MGNVPKDKVEALHWYIKASICDDDRRVDVLFKLGKIFNETNKLKGLKYFRLAAAAGCIDAKYELGKYFEIQEQKNKDEKLKWFCDAASHGHVNAQQELVKICSENISNKRKREY